MPFISSTTGSFGAGRRPFYRGIPTVLANSSEFLQIWYDLSYADTVNLSGGKVISVDGIGWASTHDANTSGASDRPEYSLASRNNLNTAVFDGTSDYFTVNPFTNFSPGGLGITGYTMFVVNKFDTIVEQRLTETNASGDSDMGFGINSDGVFEYSVGGGKATGAEADTNWHVHSYVYDGTQPDGSELAVWTDNTSVTVTETSPIGDNALTDTTVVFMGSSETPDLWFDGSLGEIIFFTRSLTLAEVQQVNLYLMTKWGVAENSYTPVYPSPWNPANDITPAYWLDASDTSSYTLSSSTLNTVTDKAGNFTVSVDGSPTRISSGLNSLNVWDFDGNESIMTGSGPYASSGNHWAIGVFQYHATDSTKDSFFSADGSRTYAVSSSQSNNTWTGEIDYDGSNSIVSGVAKNTFTTSISINTWVIVSIVFNKTGNQIFGRINGTTATSTDAYNLSMDTNASDVRMMRNRAGVKLDGRMAEYFHVAGVPGTGGTDISDVEKAEGYLAHKWGLTGGLPSSHAYKTKAP